MITTTFTNILTSGLMTVAVLSTAPQTTDNPYVFTNGQVTYEIVDTDTQGTIAENAYGSSAYWTTLWYDASRISNANALSVNNFNTVETEKSSEPVVVAKIVEPAPTAAPTSVAQKVVPVSSNNGSLNDAQITYLGNCEAGMDPAKNTGNGYYGAFQFSHGTWTNLNTGYARADLAPIEVQKAAVQQLVSKSNVFNQFPGCASKMRNAGLI